MINILIADDHSIVLDGLKALLDTESEIKIVGEAHNGKEVLKILRRNKEVDIVLLDVSMPEMDGFEVVKQMSKDYPETKIIILSMYNKKEYILRLMNMGVSGYILKSQGSDEVVEAIKKVYKGGTHFGQEVMTTATQAKGANVQGEELLTPREKEILILIGECKSTKEIAKETYIANTTVETHVRNILGKLGLETRMHLVRYAIENGFTR